MLAAPISGGPCPAQILGDAIAHSASLPCSRFFVGAQHAVPGAHPWRGAARWSLRSCRFFVGA
jgi:hypothetical protein